jgi:hypothetical protein
VETGAISTASPANICRPFLKSNSYYALLSRPRVDPASAVDAFNISTKPADVPPLTGRSLLTIDRPREIGIFLGSLKLIFFQPR